MADQGQELQQQGEPQPQALPAGMERDCWACSTRLLIPINALTSKPHEIARCSMCGAINEQRDGFDPIAGCVPTKPQPEWKTRRSKFQRGLIFLANRACVAFVLSCCIYVIFVGVYFMLPALYDWWTWQWMLSNALAYWFGFNTLFNYMMCVSTPIENPPRSAKSVQSTENLRFCAKCNRIKPPRAHHCSTCGRCVMLLDHHCIFTGRCIGHHNHRYFILFLTWLLVSVFYVLIVVYLTVFKSPRLAPVFSQTFGRFFVSSFSPFAQSTRFRISSEHILVIGAIIMETALSFATIIGVGFLLATQLWQLREGLTQIENTFPTLAGKEENPAPRGFIANAKQILGPNILLWLLPSIHDPFGSPGYELNTNEGAVPLAELGDQQNAKKQA